MMYWIKEAFSDEVRLQTYQMMGWFVFVAAVIVLSLTLP